MATTIGSASVRQLGGTIDAAFVPFPAGITRSFKISGYPNPDDSMTHYYPTSDNYTIGTTMDKIGRASGTNSGTITALSLTITVSGITFTDQLRVSNDQAAGDSGGPVFHTIVRQNQVDFHVLAGIATIADANNDAVISKVGNIISAFGITPDYGE